MPYSDNLYSGRAFDESESDDYGDEHSPSDGYFTASASSHGVPSVPNVMVPDPTLLRQQPEMAAESKEREVEQDRVAALNTRRQGHPLGNASSPGDHSYSHIEHATAPSTRTQSTYPIFTPRTPLSTSAYNPSSSSASASVVVAAAASRRPLRSLPSSRGRSASVDSDAPPAYTPSPTSPLSPTSPTNQARNYSTFSSANMGIEDERLLGRDPESMGLPNDEESVRPAWKQRVRRRLPAWATWRTTLLATVLLIASMGFLASSYRVVKDDKGNTIRPSPAVPIKQPADQAPLDPPPPGAPHPDLPALQPLESTHCKNATFRFPEQMMAVDFSKDKYFSFVEEMAFHKGHDDVSIAGQVNVRKVDGTGNPRVILEIVTNDPDLRVDVNADEADQMMKVTVPKHTTSSNPDLRPCMEMRATIYVPENAELKEMGIKTVHLDILTLDDLSLKVAEYTRLVSDLGDIVSATDKARTYTAAEKSPMTAVRDYIFVPAKETYKFDSRLIEVQTVAGNIGGTWPLYDLLGLHATAGSVQASIAPKAVLEADPKPAVLSLSTVSGALSAAEPIHELAQMPIREYLVDLKSTSGRIHGALAFSTGIDLKSTASDIAVDLLPVLDSSRVNATSPAQLETGTTSGTTAVRVLDPVWFAGWSASPSSPSPNNSPPPAPLSHAATTANKRDTGKPRPAAPITLTAMATLEQVRDTAAAAGLANQPLNCLQAVHKSTSGDIGLKYPASWVGSLAGDSTAGKLGVSGKDVRVVKSTQGLGRSELVAYVGQNGGASSIRTHSMIGNLACQIGRQ
ncbi:hypothetical protein PG994_002174 [Apiospora phragmitis]|uniref:Uncharacterized protein n=1 Tax=Apiospora phragmitis TaxID=2905665 RepID=A0ABR1WVM0_9PEZI